MKTPHSWKWELVSFQQNATRSNGKLASYSFCWEYIIRRSHLQLLEMSLPSDPTADRNRRLGWKRRGDENAQSVSDTDWTFIEGQGRLSPLAVMMAWRPIGADVWIWSPSIFPWTNKGLPITHLSMFATELTVSEWVWRELRVVREWEEKNVIVWVLSNFGTLRSRCCLMKMKRSVKNQ